MELEKKYALLLKCEATELKGKIVADRNVARNNPNKPSDSKAIFAFFSKIVIQNIYLRCTRLNEKIIR